MHQYLWIVWLCLSWWLWRRRKNLQWYVLNRAATRWPSTPIPSDGTTSSHNIKEDGNAIRTNGEHPRWITPYQKTSNTNTMSKLISPKTFQSNKSAKIFKILVKLGLIIYYTNGVIRMIPREGFGFHAFNSSTLWPSLGGVVQKHTNYVYVKVLPKNKFWNI
jgi:hypothetical protein